MTRQRRLSAFACAAAALAVTSLGARAGGPVAQASAAPSAGVAYATIPAASGQPLGVQAWLVVPGAAVRTIGSDDRMNMAQPWAGLTIASYPPDGHPGRVCESVGNPTAWRMDPAFTYFDLDCGGTTYRLSLHQDVPAFAANPAGPWYDGAQWGTPDQTLVNARWHSATYYITDAQLCHADVCTQLQPHGGSLAPSASAFAAQEQRAG